MIKIENDCVGCPPEMGCLGSSCPMRNSVHFYCDVCKDEVEELYYLDNYLLCEECYLKSSDKITSDNYEDYMDTCGDYVYEEDYEY